MRSWILTLSGCFLILVNGCIEKMPLPATINEDVEFTAGDTTYLIMSPIWDTSLGFSAPVEISIAPDGRLFVADSLARSVFVLKQDGTVLSKFDDLMNLKDRTGNPFAPIDVDVDQKMNIFMIDGSHRVYRWNQLWRQNKIKEVMTGARFVNIASGEEVSLSAGSTDWHVKLHSGEWQMDDPVWSSDQSVIDSLSKPHLFFDAGVKETSVKDVYYSSGQSLYSGVSAADGNYIYVTDNAHNRIIRIDFERSQLIRLATGEEVWTHRGVFGHTVTGYGTGAGTVNKPAALDVDFAGNIYYAQLGDFFSVHKIRPVSAGGYTTYPSVFQQGSHDIMDLWRFSKPADIAVDQKQQVYVANTLADEIQVFSSNGSFFMKAGIKEVLVDTTIWVYSGSDSALVDTFLTVERPGILDTPRGLAVDDRGIIYVCDTVNSRIVRYRLSNTVDENVIPDE
ncbi:MAG: NHL repeat-containing protein [Candidatus Neomarinimicrobiota bacterium]|nr:NHL repeat-containing protein [Candidatus Neomarinimicrobiota bacterium]